VDDLRGQLIGAWRVRSYDDRDSIEKEWVETYGPDVDGLIVYHESGWLTVSVAGRGGKLDSYFGRFDVVEISEEHGDLTGVLNHLIVASSVPELLTADPARPFRISGDTLVLGDEETWRRICERVG
jgi:Lipocalin-like domain